MTVRWHTPVLIKTYTNRTRLSPDDAPSLPPNGGTLKTRFCAKEMLRLSRIKPKYRYVYE